MIILETDCCSYYTSRNYSSWQTLEMHHLKYIHTLTVLNLDNKGILYKTFYRFWHSSNWVICNLELVDVGLKGNCSHSPLLNSTLIAQKSVQFNEFTILTSYILSANDVSRCFIIVSNVTYFNSKITLKLNGLIEIVVRKLEVIIWNLNYYAMRILKIIFSNYKYF